MTGNLISTCVSGATLLACDLLAQDGVLPFWLALAIAIFAAFILGRSISHWRKAHGGR